MGVLALGLPPSRLFTLPHVVGGAVCCPLSALGRNSASMALAPKTIPGFLQGGVLGAIGMALRTVSLALVVVGAKEVLAARDRLHMGRVHAPLHATKMVNVETIGNLTLRQFVGQAVRQHFALDPMPKDAYHAIATLGNVTSPQKTVSQFRSGWRQRPGYGLVYQALLQWLGPDPLFPVTKMSAMNRHVSPRLG